MRGNLRAGMKPPTSQIPQEDEPPKRGLARAWEVVKMLYENDVTRSIGRDLVFFAGAVVVVRFLVVALDEPPSPGSAPSLPLPGK
jgi:hypothetical protein